MVSTCVCAWLSLCQVFRLMASVFFGYAVPGFPSVLSFYLPQSDKRVVLTHYACAWLLLCHVCLLVARKKKVVLTHVIICLYFASLSHSCFHEGDDFNICAYLAFSLSTVMSSFVSQGEKGLALTYVCTWLSLCHVFLRITR